LCGKCRLFEEGDIPSLSWKLLAKSSFTIEAGISLQSCDIDLLKEKLNKIDGVKAIEVKNEILQIQCSCDTTSEIARAIIDAGSGLNFLNKKEYGLDDIYYRYFEGGVHHE